MYHKKYYMMCCEKLHQGFLFLVFMERKNETIQHKENGDAKYENHDN